MPRNPFSQSGRQAMALTPGAGKQFYVVGSTSVFFSEYQSLFPVDEDGVVLVYSSWTAALAACVTSRGDVIYNSPDFATAPTAAELLIAETKGVILLQAGQVSSTGEFTAMRATAVLPQSVQGALFTVTGRVRLSLIIGEVTTAIQNQANNTKIVSNPTVGADVDICAVTSTANAAVGTQLSITGTFATALVVTPSGALVYQASGVVLTAGTLDLNCAASNTGSVKWSIRYTPIDPGARLIAA